MHLGEFSGVLSNELIRQCPVNFFRFSGGGPFPIRSSYYTDVLVMYHTFVSYDRPFYLGSIIFVL